MSNHKNVVLITGATSGFGRSAALYLAGKGYWVYGFGRSVESKPDAPDNPVMLKMDVKDDLSVSAAVDSVLKREGRVDVLLNVAGTGLSGAVEDVSVNEAMGIFEANVFGSMRVSQAVLPYMRKRGSGLIVFVSSIGGLIGLPFQGLYSSTKFAVEGLAESLSIEVRPFGVDVVIVEPGDFKTEFTANRLKAVKACSEASAYYKAYNRAMRKIEHDETTGYKPEIFADTIEKIIVSRRRKLRYVIGSPLQRASVLLKKLLPARLFEKVISRYYM